MGNMTKCGPWIRRFLLEHLVSDRNLARNTQQSYRDTLALLLPFVATRVRRPIDELEVAHVSVDSVRQFLQHLEQARSCGLATRNQRLAVIHAFARFVGEHSPEHIEWSGQVRAIPFKKAPKTSVTYLEKTEMDALLAAPNRSCVQGNRDYTLLLFLYNTGARADEAARLTINDLHLSQVPHREQSFVLIRGKGNKQRMCPPMATYDNTTEGPNRHPRCCRCGFPQSMRSTDYTIWDPHHGGAPCQDGLPYDAGVGEEKS